MQPGIVLIIGLMLSGLSPLRCLRADTFYVPEYTKYFYKTDPRNSIENVLYIQLQKEGNLQAERQKRLAWAKSPPAHSFSSTSLDDDVEPTQTVHPGFNPQSQARLEKMDLQQAYKYCHSIMAV